MKYFSLLEVISAVPLAILLGLFAALLRVLLFALAAGSLGFLEIGTYYRCKRAKIKYKFKTNRLSELEKTRPGLIITEVVSCILNVFLSLLFCIFLYVVSDGLVRVYICIFFLLTYYLFYVWLRVPLSSIIGVPTELFWRPIFFIAYLMIMAAKGVKGVKKKREVKKKSKIQKENHNFLHKSACK